MFPFILINPVPLGNVFVKRFGQEEGGELFFSAGSNDVQKDLLSEVFKLSFLGNAGSANVPVGFSAFDGKAVDSHIVVIFVNYSDILAACVLFG